MAGRKKSQKLYKMKGCNKKSRKNRIGGSSKAEMNLAYPSNDVATVPNPFLAYTGKGGSTKSLNAATYPVAYPNPGPPPGGFNFLNPQNTQKGGAQMGGTQMGGCGCGVQLGGSSQKAGCGGSCAVAPLAMIGGKHRVACKCSNCKKTMKGGSGNNGIPYPNGLVGSAWTPAVNGWPGVDGISGNRNYLELNKFQMDPETAIVDVGRQAPFSVGGGRRKKGKKGQKGGALSNFLAQDLINLGRQFQYGVGSAYNGLLGFSSPVNPMPWKGQIPNTANLSTIRAASI